VVEFRLFVPELEEKPELNHVLNGLAPIQTLKPVFVCQNAIVYYLLE
jgi:hypothetical protein